MADTFFNFVAEQENGCWEWTGSRHGQGYGRYRQGNLIAKAHRVSFERHKGPIPKGMFVCHSCDNPACVNPEHLWLGSHRENMADMARKGRASRDPTPKLGERNPAAKLSAEAVEQIKSLRGKVSQRELGRRFGVSQSMIYLIQVGKNWTH